MNIIACCGPNNELGYKNDLIYHIKEDMEFFKSMTMSRAVIMGRKTFESIGKPLPFRLNIVISHNKDYGTKFFNYRLNFKVATNLEEAIRIANKYDFYDDDIFITGGAEIYNQTINKCKNLYITKVIDHSSEADTFFPQINRNIFRESYVLRSGKTTLNNDSNLTINYKIIQYVNSNKDL